MAKKVRIKSDDYYDIDLSSYSEEKEIRRRSRIMTPREYVEQVRAWRELRKKKGKYER